MTRGVGQCQGVVCASGDAGGRGCVLLRRHLLLHGRVEVMEVVGLHREAVHRHLAACLEREARHVPPRRGAARRVGRLERCEVGPVRLPGAIHPRQVHHVDRVRGVVLGELDVAVYPAHVLLEASPRGPVTRHRRFPQLNRHAVHLDAGAWGCRPSHTALQAPHSSMMAVHACIPTCGGL